MKMRKVTRNEHRDILFAIAIALFYLASAVIDLVFSVVVLCILMGAGVALGIRAYLSDRASGPFLG